MANSDIGTKPTSVKADTNTYGQNSTKSSSSRRDSESAKARRDLELSKAKKFIEELSLQMEKSNNVTKLLKTDVEEEVSRLNLDEVSVLSERVAAEKEVDESRFKTEEEEEEEGKEVSDLLVEKKKRIKEMSEEVEKSKNVEKELFETVSDIEMLETQLNLVKKMERRVSRSNRSFESGRRYSLSALKEVTETTEAKKEELGSVEAELFKLMTVIDALRNEVIEAKEETARFEGILGKADVKIQKLNSKMLMAKSKLRIALSAKERFTSLTDNLVCSLDKLKRNREAAKKEERFLKEEKTVTKAETERTKLEIDKKERELISKLDELEKAKRSESLVLEKLESLIEDTMNRREMESEKSSTITISRFEYEYLSKHASEAEETAEKKVAAAEAWVEAVKCSTKAVSLKTETLIRESGMARVEEEKEDFKTEMSLSGKRLVEGEIEKIKRDSEAESYPSPKAVGKLTPVRRGKPRRYSSAGTPTFFVIKKKKKKVPTLVKFFGRRR